MRRPSSRLIAALLLALAGCDEAPAPVDGGTAFDGGIVARDAGPVSDGGHLDAGPAPDGGPADGGVPPMELAFSGDGCAALGMEVVEGTAPGFLELVGTLEVDGEELDEAGLLPGTRTILEEGTAGGSSGLSEALAFEALGRCFGASLLASETRILYGDEPTTPWEGPRTDLLVEIDDVNLGVSVTRAFTFQSPTFTEEAALALLVDKLADIPLSTEGLNLAGNAVPRQFLFVLAYAADHVEDLDAAWSGLSLPERGDTLVIVMRTDGPDCSVYTQSPSGCR